MLTYEGNSPCCSTYRPLFYKSHDRGICLSHSSSPLTTHSTRQLCHQLLLCLLSSFSPSLFLQPPLRLVCPVMNSVANRAAAPFLTEAISLSSPVNQLVPRCAAHHRYHNLRVYEVSPVVPLLTPPMRAIQVSWGL